MIKIGFDLDGVIVDNTVFKSDVFYKKTGLHLKNWNLNSNVIDNYIPNIDLRREIDKLSATSIHKTATEKNIVKILLKIKSNAEVYLISSRGKSEDGLFAAQKTIEKLKIAPVFKNNVFL